MKNRFLCTIVLALLLVSAAQAYTCYWGDSEFPPVDNDWENSLNWIAWPPPDWIPTHGTPTASEDAELNRALYTEVGTGDAAVCQALRVGTDTSHTLGVVGGTLTVGNEIVIGTGGGTTGYMDVSGGTTFVTSNLNVGGGGLPEWGWGPGVGDLDVFGGAVQIGGSLVLGQTLTYGEVSQTGTGTVTIEGGVVIAVGLTIETGSLMCVYDDGLMVLAGDQLALVNGYIGDGLLFGLASIPDSGPYAGNTVIETPEPATLTLFTLAGIALLRRRKM